MKIEIFKIFLIFFGIEYFLKFENAFKFRKFREIENFEFFLLFL